MYPEKPERILRESAAFRSIPRDLPYPELLSVSWRSDVLLGLSAAGVFSLEDQIVGITRNVFHDGLSHHDLSTRLFGADYDTIHGWMDTVPGATVRGGGILHRLQHGHDFDAAREIHEQHGVAGVLVWAQHVAQDATTPTGIPFPIGGERLAGYLVDSGIASPGKAALMLSLNVAELAASFLAGAFALRLAGLVCDLQRRRVVKRLCDRARDAREVGDLDGVIAHYSAARAEADGDPAIEMALGWAYAELGRPAAESFLAFRAAAEGLSRTDATVDLQGVRVDLRGLAYLLALSQAREVLSQNDLRAGWRSELDRMLRVALWSFERRARVCHERHAVRAMGRELEWRPRPFSAAANYYLAGRLAHGAPFLPSASDAPRLGDLALGQLSRARSLYPEHRAGIEAVQRRWGLELAPTAVRAERAA